MEWVNIVFNVIAIIIVTWAISTAFDPKYRYNEHCKWEPGPYEVVWMLFLWLCVVRAILG